MKFSNLAIEAGRLSLSLEPVEIAGTLKKASILSTPRSRARIRLNGPWRRLPRPGRRQRLKQVLINLISTH